MSILILAVGYKQLGNTVCIYIIQFKSKFLLLFLLLWSLGAAVIAVFLVILLISTLKELDDAKKEIEDGQKEINDNRKKLADAKKTLDSSKKKLEDAKKQLDKAKKELTSGWNKIEDNKASIRKKVKGVIDKLIGEDSSKYIKWASRKKLNLNNKVFSKNYLKKKKKL